VESEKIETVDQVEAKGFTTIALADVSEMAATLAFERYARTCSDAERALMTAMREIVEFVTGEECTGPIMPPKVVGGKLKEIQIRNGE